MAFTGSTFKFDGVSSRAFGYVIYNFDSYQQDSTSKLTSTGTVVSDKVEGRISPLHYGIKRDKPLEFTLVFGRNSPGTDERMRRIEIKRTNDWLSNKDTYRYLAIDQPDMKHYRYRCLISDLEVITAGAGQIAFKCKVTCDSPYATILPEVSTYRLGATPQKVMLFNRSSLPGPYYPDMEIVSQLKTDICVQNNTTGTKFTLAIPTSNRYTIRISGTNQVIESDPHLNFYPHCNLEFLDLAKGQNELLLSGAGTLKIKCEFPVDIGG